MAKLLPQETTLLQELLERVPVVSRATERIVAAGGTAYLVGGAVRDTVRLQKVTAADIDIEVHGLSLEQLQEVLRAFGPVSLVGKSFGVLKLAGADIDFALPRTDASGRKPVVTIDKDLPLRDALARRDLTMNALAIDLHSYELHDPFGGRADMQAGVLRSPDPRFFTEDPLRFYRVMQFVGRFGMEPDAHLNDVCKSMDIAQISKERIAAEFDKLVLLSRTPSRGIRWLRTIGRLQEILPEVAMQIGVEQEFEFHPEGDVFEHSMQAFDAAAQAHYPDRHTRLAITYAALCHDLGKAVTTKVIDGRIRSFNHEVAGVPIAQALLERIMINKELIHKTLLLVRHHMAPGNLTKSNAGAAAYKRLADELAPALNLKTLTYLVCADRRGRNGAKGEPLPDCPDADLALFVERATAYGVFEHPEPPVMMGADLMDVIPPGPQLGEALKKAYKIQINKGITDKAQLRRRVLS